MTAFEVTRFWQLRNLRTNTRTVMARHAVSLRDSEAANA